MARTATCATLLSVFLLLGCSDFSRPIQDPVLADRDEGLIGLWHGEVSGQSGNPLHVVLSIAKPKSTRLPESILEVQPLMFDNTEQQAKSWNGPNFLTLSPSFRVPTTQNPVLFMSTGEFEEGRFISVLADTKGTVDFRKDSYTAWESLADSEQSVFIARYELNDDKLEIYSITKDSPDSRAENRSLPASRSGQEISSGQGLKLASPGATIQNYAYPGIRTEAFETGAIAKRIRAEGADQVFGEHVATFYRIKLPKVSTSE